MNDIQQARDVLQRWRDDSDGNTPGAWRVDSTASIFPTVRDQDSGEIAHSLLSEDARLIVGTAGNPDLLDAIYVLLDTAAWNADGFGDGIVDPMHKRIAAAILSADERMQQ